MNRRHKKGAGIVAVLALVFVTGLFVTSSMATTTPPPCPEATISWGYHPPPDECQPPTTTEPEPVYVEVCDPQTGEIITVPEEEAEQYLPVDDPACAEEPPPPPPPDEAPPPSTEGSTTGGTEPPGKKTELPHTL